MIHVDPTSIAGRYFVWCCDTLPMSVTRDYSKDNGDHNGVRRTGAHYIESGTNLCHLFWAMFWVPLIWVAICRVGISVLFYMHYAPYDKYGALWALFLPEILGAGLCAAAGVVILVIMGASKIGPWAYLTALKQRICPIVQFGDQGAE